jgi:hypothetical protein
VHIGTVPIDHELLNKIIENQIEARREHSAGGFDSPVVKQGCLKMSNGRSWSGRREETGRSSY